MKTASTKRHPQPGLTKTDKKDNQVISTALKQAASTGKSPFTPGNKSAAVGALKHLLAVDGYQTPNGDTFDTATSTALEEFQTAMGLKGNGTLNEDTFKTLVGTETSIREHPGELEVGEKNARMAGIEKDLTTLGYENQPTPPGDDVYSKADAAAMTSFRRADGIKVYRSDAIGTTGEKALAADVKALDHTPYRSRLAPPKNLKALNSDTAKAVTKVNADGTSGVALRAKGSVVSFIQAHLRAAGYDPKGDNGTFGARTVGAVEAFQKHSGLPVTGVVDAQTWAALQKTTIYTKNASNPPQALGENDRTVKTTQSDLIQAGFGKHLRATGLFDTATETAVKNFQKKYRLEVTGEVNGATLRKLETVAAANGWHAGSWHKGPGTLYGADTSSSYQSDAQFQQSIKGAEWTAIKATDGVSANQDTFQQRWAELGRRVASGKMKLRMAYCFLEPGHSGVAQAQTFLNTVGVHGKLPAGTRLALDWEQGALADPGALRDAANYIHKVTGIWPVVYCQGSEVSAAESTVPHCPIWEAEVADNAGDPLPVSERNRNVPFFQYSWVPGYDHDQFNGNLSALEKFAGYS
jgi:peptidoglycan hydrolase-like protein with peptidoglycan-binding domain